MTIQLLSPHRECLITQSKKISDSDAKVTSGAPPSSSMRPRPRTSLRFDVDNAEWEKKETVASERIAALMNVQLCN